MHPTLTVMFSVSSDVKHWIRIDFPLKINFDRIEEGKIAIWSSFVHPLQLNKLITWTFRALQALQIDGGHL